MTKRVACRHCPKAIHQHAVSGLWVDDRGVEVCIPGIVGTRSAVLHEPMPAITTPRP